MTTPDKWVVLKIVGGYKVFATWAGGYLGGDGWRVNSGITKVEEDEEYYYFHGYSGSTYKCHKNSYGVITAYGRSTLDRILDVGADKVELMDENTDWIKLVESCQN